MKRVLTAVLLGVPAGWVLFRGHPFLVFAIVGLIAVLCFREYLAIAGHHQFRHGGLLGYAAGVVLLSMPQIDAGLVALTAMLVFAAAVAGPDLAAVLPRAAVMHFGVVYVFAGWRCGLQLHQINPHWLFFALVVSWIGDTAAFLVGSRFGRHKLAPRISPAKSWEGFFASLLVSAAFGILYLGRFLPQFSAWESIAVASVANLAGQAGDLCESAIKRGAGVKDSGAMLPGHGGWLDRVDSCLFSMPVVYLWLSRLSPVW